MTKKEKPAGGDADYHSKRQISTRLSEDDIKLLEKLGKTHGSKAAAISLALRRLDGSNGGPEDLLRRIRERIEKEGY